MSGFAGCISRKYQISEFKVREIASHVSFRGTDDTCISVYNDAFMKSETGNHAFFFHHLAIPNLKQQCNQYFENDRYTLLFDGKIYNYLFLKKELENKGICFRTVSDLEVLFHGLIGYGKDYVFQLDGMFAFAFIDRKERTFLLVRDRMGIKPLCYSILNGCLIFGSEIDSIVRLMSDKPEISRQAVNLFLAFQYVPTPFTIWENVNKLPPGSFLEGKMNDLNENKTLTPQIYWDAYEQLQKEPLQCDLESLLVNSVQKQLQTNVPLGLFLSSGVDSSLLTAIVNKHFRNEQQINFFTIAFNQETLSDESKDAEQFLSAFKNDSFIHHQLCIDADYIQQSFLGMYHYTDEPFADCAMMLNHSIAQKAKEYVSVVLSGDGADELFWGYTRYNQWIRCKSQISRNAFFKKLQPLWNMIYPIKEKLKWRTENNPLAIYLYLVTSSFRNMDHLIENKSCWGLNIPDILMRRNDLPYIADIKNYLPDCGFYKVDRANMGASLDVRVPYLDHAIVNYGLRLPLKSKSTETYPSKAPLKELLFHIAPHYDIQKPKKGFNFPLKEWITSEWKDLIFSVVNKENIESVYLNPKFVKLLEQHYYKGIDHTTELWYLFNLLYWKKKKFELLY